MSDADKALAGENAAARVRDGMLVGLGTGSTAEHFIRALARRTRQGLRITGVPSSYASAHLARSLGLALVALDEVARVDVYADGADEVTPRGELLKGRGAAMLRERILATSCDNFVVMVDGSKQVERLGTRFPVPVETLPAAWRSVAAKLEALGASANLRHGQGKDGPVITDQGNFVLDLSLPAGWDPLHWDQALTRLPGVLGHGIFVGLSPTILCAEGGAVTVSAPPAPA